MKLIKTISISILVFSGCNRQNSNDDLPIGHYKVEHSPNKMDSVVDIPCPDSWYAYKPTADELNFELEKGIVEKQSNDSTIQQIRYGKVWFEMINPIKINKNVFKCYLINYRLDGSLESKGSGIYYEHPVVEYTMDVF